MRRARAQASAAIRQAFVDHVLAAAGPLDADVRAPHDRPRDAAEAPDHPMSAWAPAGIHHALGLRARHDRATMRLVLDRAFRRTDPGEPAGLTVSDEGFGYYVVDRLLAPYENPSSGRAEREFLLYEAMAVELRREDADTAASLGGSGSADKSTVRPAATSAPALRWPADPGALSGVVRYSRNRRRPYGVARPLPTREELIAYFASRPAAAATGRDPGPL